jgi:protein O-GlcNAc transferase
VSRSPHLIQQAVELLNADQNAQARTLLRRIIQKDARDPDAHKLLGMLHAGLEENDQALFYLQRAAALAPKDPYIQFVLGNLLMVMRKDKEAAAAYRATVTLAPANFQGYDGLARVLLRMGKHDEGVEAYERGVAAAPDDPAAYRMYAAAMSTLGRVDEALAVLQRGAARLPQDVGLRESLCYQLNFSEEPPARVLEEHRALGALVHEQRAGLPPVALANTPDPARRLRLGVVSGDFCSHACALFMEGALRALDREKFELFLYYTRAEVEPTTARFQAMGQWRHCHGMSDDALRARVAADGVDVLIDTAGWTELHRLQCFVPRVAPVQMTWLGYPNTTGLPTMDYRIVDWVTDPAGAERWSTEQLIRLERCFVSFLPLATAPEARMTAELEGDGPITFGSFNRLSKVRERTARVWARVLARVPGSRLFLKSSLVSEDVKGQYERVFAAEGVGPERLLWSSFVAGMESHLAAYHRVDVALDSFPYNGTTTTCEALWMGVPVVALRGEVHRARVGASLLRAVGLEELVAGTEEEYVEIAAGLAQDRERLRGLHRGLRASMAASELCDGAGFARALEGAVRGAWERWCAGRVA